MKKPNGLHKHRAEKREKEKVRHTARTLKQAVETIEELEEELQAARRLQSRNTSLVIHPRRSSKTSEATAVALFTDLHIGNTITLAQTNGINEYNTAIARKRAATFFERVVRLTDKERQDVHIEELVLFLGGDFIDGTLHMDVIQTNNPATPMEQAVIAQDIIEAGLMYLEKHGNFKRITIVCKDGNHGRVSVKMHWNSRIGNSLEWFLFYNLARRYPQFNWIVDESFLSYLKIYDWVFRFHHGDRIYFGGQNGFYSNYHILISSDNASVVADFDVTGHLHQYTTTRRYVVNGSVVGYSPYGMASRSFMKGEPATQAFFLVDKKRRITVNIPILL